MRKIILTWLALCAALFGAWQLSALDIPRFKSAHIERLLVSPAHTQLLLTGAGAGAPTSAGGESYQWIGSGDKADLSDTENFTMSIPAGYVVVAVLTQNGSFVSVTAGSTGLTQDTINANTPMAIYSGAVATSSTNLAVVTSGGTGGDRVVAVWVISNITTPSKKQVNPFTGGSCTISVSAGDFMFAMNANGDNYSSSTQAPSNACSAQCSISTINGGPLLVADWSIVSTNASFSVAASGYSYNVVATYH